MPIPLRRADDSLSSMSEAVRKSQQHSPEIERPLTVRGGFRSTKGGPPGLAVRGRRANKELPVDGPRGRSTTFTSRTGTTNSSPL